MCDPARLRAYQDSWTQVKLAYYGGFIVSERGLQAVLYRELQARLLGVHVVVEPTWTKKTPDLVIIEGGEITDIFELKFVPQGYATWEYDIAKLHAYVGNAEYRVCLNPRTGYWAAPLPVRVGCYLHFVAVARHDAEAVLSLGGQGQGINHWFGRVGGADGWDIDFARPRWRAR